MARGQFTTGDGTRYIADIRRHGGLRAAAKWAAFILAIIGTFLLGVRLGTGGIYLDSVESLERLAVDDPSDLLAPVFRKLRQADATEDLSKLEIAQNLDAIKNQCIETGGKADEAWQTYFTGLRAIISSEVGGLKKSSELQARLLKGLGPTGTRAEQQCSRSRELLELILFQLAAPDERASASSSP
jgi:hypothetical protein